MQYCKLLKRIMHASILYTLYLVCTVYYVDIYHKYFATLLDTNKHGVRYLE